MMSYNRWLYLSALDWAIRHYMESTNYTGEARAMAEGFGRSWVEVATRLASAGNVL